VWQTRTVRKKASRPRLESRWDRVGGIRLHSRAGGAGPPVVLVHGYGVSGRYLLPLARLLAGSCSAYVPDLPGHGRSERLEVAPGIGELSDLLSDWLDEVGLERPAFVANSMGCQIVTQLAVRSPERVGPMVLSGPTVDPARRGGRRQIFAGLRETAREPVSLVALAARDGLGHDVQQLRAAARSALDDRIEERLPSIEQPTVVVHGERDAFVSREWAEQVAALLPHGRLVVVPGEPHAVPYTKPHLVAGIVWQLVAEEGEQGERELVGRFPHRNVPARQLHEPRVRKLRLPLFGDSRGYESVVLAPDE
jgi:2-hydroxy-6-oxonona-2,4-dienedioate hydrolase